MESYCNTTPEYAPLKTLREFSSQDASLNLIHLFCGVCEASITAGSLDQGEGTLCSAG
ncbi:UNVERIFIED_CONTAM: hypothetical protein FKN15_078226 [Acipenser sinensis]